MTTWHVRTNNHLPVILSSIAELGDYEEGVHDAGFVSEFHFTRDQSPEMELEILEKFKQCK